MSRLLERPQAVIKSGKLVEARDAIAMALDARTGRSPRTSRARSTWPPAELEEWLDNAGKPHASGSRASGRERKRRPCQRPRDRQNPAQAATVELTDDDYAHMRKVVGFVAPPPRAAPAEHVTSRWRYSPDELGPRPARRRTSMKGFQRQYREADRRQRDFRRVLYTGDLQLVLMTLQPGEEIGSEVHEDRDQFFRFEEGEGVVDIDGVENTVEDGSGVIVPAGRAPQCPQHRRRAAEALHPLRPARASRTASSRRPRPRPSAPPRRGMGRQDDRVVAGRPPLPLRSAGKGGCDADHDQTCVRDFRRLSLAAQRPLRRRPISTPAG